MLPREASRYYRMSAEQEHEDALVQWNRLVDGRLSFTWPKQIPTGCPVA